MMVKRPETTLKACFDPQMIDGIIRRIDTDTAIGPKGIAQIEFYNQLVQTLRFGSEMMEVTVEREVYEPDPVEVPATGGTPVWTSENNENQDNYPGFDDHDHGFDTN